jgi:hypothetical protein
LLVGSLVILFLANQPTIKLTNGYVVTLYSLGEIMHRLRILYFIIPLLFALTFVGLTTSMLSADTEEEALALDVAASAPDIAAGETAVFTITLANTDAVMNSAALSITVSGPINSSQFDLVESILVNTQAFNQPPDRLRWGGQIGPGGSLTARVTVKTLPFVGEDSGDLTLLASAGPNPITQPITATISVGVTPPAGTPQASFSATLLDQSGEPLLSDGQGNHLQLLGQPVRARLIFTNTGAAPLVSLLTGDFTADAPLLNALDMEENSAACRVRVSEGKIIQGNGFVVPLAPFDSPPPPDYVFLITTPPGETTIVEALVKPLGSLDCALTYNNQTRSRSLPPGFDRPVTPSPRVISALLDLPPNPAASLLLLLLASDYGDAPTSANNFGAPMTAYSGVAANFPTVFDAAYHRFARPMRLGQQASLELSPDQGWGRNLIPLSDLADLDVWDDGLASTALTFGHCQPTTLSVSVSFSQFALDLLNSEDKTAYLNVWLDGNRDGDWSDDDILDCDGLQATEHIVIDQPVLPATAGQLTLVVPTRNLPIPQEQVGEEMWLRLTLSDEPSVKTAQVNAQGQIIEYGDGRGPVGGFRLGETEDYLINPAPSRGAHLALSAIVSAWQAIDEDENGRAPDAFNLRNFFRQSITIRNLGGLLASGKLIVETSPYLGLPDIVGTAWTGCLTCTLRTADAPLATTAPTNLFTEVCPLPGQCHLELPLSDIEPGFQGELFLRWKVEEGEWFRVVDFATRVETDGAGGPLPGSAFSGEARQVVGAPIILRPLNGVFRPTTPYTGSIPSLAWVLPQVTVQGQPGTTAEVFGNGILLDEITFDGEGLWRGALPTPDGDVSLAVAYTAVPGLPPAAIPLLDKSTPTHLRLNSALPWNPASLGQSWTGCLTCTLRINNVAPMIPIMDRNGWVEVSGWQIPFRPNEAMELAVELADMPADTPVWLKLGNQTPLGMVEAGNGRYTITLTLPATANGADVSLFIGCDHLDPNVVNAPLANGECWEFTGLLQRVAPATVADRQTGDPLPQAQVALWQYRRTTQGVQGLLWHAPTFGQENPIFTNDDGQFSAILPRGFYGITVRQAGYQPFRYGPFPFNGALPSATVGLTPLPITATLRAPLNTTEVNLTEAGFERQLLEVTPGTIVRFSNLSGEFMHVLDAPGGSSNANSGLLTPGESYLFSFATPGSYLLTNGEDPSETLLVLVQPATEGERIYLPLIVR